MRVVVVVVVAALVLTAPKTLSLSGDFTQICKLFSSLIYAQLNISNYYVLCYKYIARSYIHIF